MLLALRRYSAIWVILPVLTVVGLMFGQSAQAMANETQMANAATEWHTEQQTFSVPSTVAAPAVSARDSYATTVVSVVAWPLPGGANVPISSGFGARHVANCGFCSTYHEGIDFDPSSGTSITAVADGVVTFAGSGGSYSGLGYHVEIQHNINGQVVQSVYGHMIAGSIQVTEGETVKVGQAVGLVGSTGASTGPHLHLEIHLNGTPVDPLPWMRANVNIQNWT